MNQIEIALSFWRAYNWSTLIRVNESAIFLDRMHGAILIGSLCTRVHQTMKSGWNIDADDVPSVLWKINFLVRFHVTFHRLAFFPSCNTNHRRWQNEFINLNRHHDQRTHCKQRGIIGIGSVCWWWTFHHSETDEHNAQRHGYDVQPNWRWYLCIHRGRGLGCNVWRFRNIPLLSATFVWSIICQRTFWYFQHNSINMREKSVRIWINIGCRCDVHCVSDPMIGAEWLCIRCIWRKN